MLKSITAAKYLDELSYKPTMFSLVPFIKVTNETNVRCSPDRFPGARKSDLTDARFFQILFF